MSASDHNTRQQTFRTLPSRRLRSPFHSNTDTRVSEQHLFERLQKAYLLAVQSEHIRPARVQNVAVSHRAAQHQSVAEPEGNSAGKAEKVTRDSQYIIISKVYIFLTSGESP